MKKVIIPLYGSPDAWIERIGEYVEIPEDRPHPNPIKGRIVAVRSGIPLSQIVIERIVH